MIIKVKFKCDSCLHINRQRMGEKGFEILQYEFDSITDVWHHIQENPIHYIESFVDDSEAYQP